MPVEELAETSGHWIWQRDEGSRWLLDETAGPAASFFQQAFTAEPEHWFRIRDDGKWVVRAVTPGTTTCGDEEVLDVSGKLQEGIMQLGAEEVLGSTRTYIEANKLVIEWQGTRSRGAKVHLKNSKEVILGMYHSTVEDLVRNAAGTRIFKRFPWYRIDNKTGETLTLKTFTTADFLYLIPAMTVEVKPGLHFVDASAGNKDEEQAIFALANGRDLTCLIKAFQTITLKSEDFQQCPTYKIENQTGEPVSLTTYAVGDFMYLVPAMTVEVAPGTSHVTASSRDTSEEQAVFTLVDGRTYKGITLKAFETTTLKCESFTEYPHYQVENHTGDTVTLTTYSVGDFIYLVPAMVVEVAPGKSRVHGSSRDVTEEQATFRTRDGRTFAGFNIKAFQTVVLKREFFK